MKTPKKKLRILLFDIDGTLINSGGAGQAAFLDALREGFGVDGTYDDVPFAGQTDPLIVREFFVRHNLEFNKRSLNTFFEHYLHFLQKKVLKVKGHVKPGVQEILELCGKSNGNGCVFRAALLTGNIEAGAKIKLEYYDLWKYFEFGAFASDHEIRDEIARIAHQRVLKKFGSVAPEDILVIGDTPRDVQCGKVIGARTVAVATGPHSLKELQGCKPTITLPDLSQVKDFLDWASRD